MADDFEGALDAQGSDDAGADTDNTPEADESTGDEGGSDTPAWLERLAGLDDDERTQAAAMLQKALVRLKHGKTGQALDLPIDEVLNLAERGFDAESKWQQTAEIRRVAEQLGGFEQLAAAVQLAQYVKANPFIAASLAQTAQQYEPTGVPQTPQEAVLMQRLAQYEQAEQQRRQQGAVQEINAKLAADVQRLVAANPALFDEKTAGSQARLNLWKLRQEAEKLSQTGYYSEDIMEYAFHRAFGKNLASAERKRYVSEKTRQGPPVAGAGTPAGRDTSPKNLADSHARARARIERYGIA